MEGNASVYQVSRVSKSNNRWWEGGEFLRTLGAGGGAKKSYSSSVIFVVFFRITDPVCTDDCRWVERTV